MYMPREFCSSKQGFLVNSVHAARCVLLVVFGMVAFRAAADSPPPLELTAANL
jgi:hypothetical protein